MHWKKTFRWTAAVLGILIAVLLVSGFVILRTNWFHAYVLSKIVADGQSATGGKLAVQNWALNLSARTVELDSIVLHGSEPANARPLLQADKLIVGVNLHDLLRRKLKLSEILIEHPVANLTVSGNGVTNLPTPPATQTSSSTNIWDLAVRRTVISRGEIYYNDKKTQLNAEVYDLQTEVRFDPSATRYAGSLSYQNGQLQYAANPPFPNSLNIQFSATPGGCSVNSLLLAVGSSQISLQGELINYARPKIDATYRMLVRTQELASFSPGLSSSGDVNLAGGIHYQEIPGQPLLRNVLLDGDLVSNELHAASADGRLQVRNLKAQYRLAAGNLQVHNIIADLIGGKLAADVNLQQIDGTPRGKIHASLRHASLESAKQSMNRADVKRMPVTGTVDAAADGVWTANLKNIRLNSRIGLRAALWDESVTPRSATPIDGDAHISYDGAHNIVTLHQTTVRTPRNSLAVDGQLGTHSNLQVHVLAGDLREFATLASSLRQAGSEPESQPIAISGTAKLDAIVQGSVQKPHVSGQFDAENLQVQGSQWKYARLSLQASPEQFKVTQGLLQSAHQGTASFSADVALKDWSYLPAKPIAAKLSIQGMSLTDLEHLANLSYPVSGNLSADLSFHGSQLNPAGQGSLRIVKANAYDQPIQNLTAQFQADGGSIHSNLNLAIPAGSLSANLDFSPGPKSYKIDAHTSGVVLQKLHVVEARNLPLAGTLTFSASGSGTFDHPQLDATLQLPNLQVQQTAISGINAKLDVHDQRADFALTSSVTQAFVRANGSLELTGDYNAQATIDTNRVALDPVLALYAPSVPAGFHGETELHATMKGPLKDISRIEAHVTVPTLSASYQSLQFSNATPIRADFSNSVISLAPAEIRGNDTSLRFQGRVPVQANAPIALQAQGNVNLALLQMFNSDLKSSGFITLDVHGAGSLHNPQVGGEIQVKNAVLTTSSSPISLSKVNGTLDITKDRVQITNLKAEAGGGEISVGGSVVYSPNLQFNVALQGKSIRLLYPDGVRAVLDSNLLLAGNLQSATLNGRTVIDSLGFTPDFDIGNFASQFNGISVPSSGQSILDRINLGVSVQSNQSLSARSSQLNLEGMVNLKVTGTAAEPVILGRVDLTSGELFFMSNRYELRRGLVTFDDPNETRPILNVQATSTIQQYNLTLTLNGPIDKLSTSYVSDPSLPTADIISLIYRGETTEQASASGTSADSILASGAAGKFSSGLQNLAGISSLQIDPLIGGDNTNPSARIALQQRVTKNLLFTFSTDVSQPGQEIVQGEYQINKRWSVSTTRDQLGGISVDGRYHTKF